MVVQSYRGKSINILLISVLILQSACRGWIEKPIVPDTGTAIPRRGTLRVTKSDGTVISLSDSFITRDSITGFSSDTSLARTAVARSGVTRIEMRGDTTPQGLRTAGKGYLIWLEVVAIVGLGAIDIVLWR